MGVLYHTLFPFSSILKGFIESFYGSLCCGTVWPRRMGPFPLRHRGGRGTPPGPGKKSSVPCAEGCTGHGGTCCLPRWALRCEQGHDVLRMPEPGPLAPAARWIVSGAAWEGRAFPARTGCQPDKKDRPGHRSVRPISSVPTCLRRWCRACIPGAWPGPWT